MKHINLFEETNCFDETHYLINTVEGFFYMPKSYYRENFSNYFILYSGSFEEVSAECKRRLNNSG